MVTFTRGLGLTGRRRTGLSLAAGFAVGIGGFGGLETVGFAQVWKVSVLTPEGSDLAMAGSIGGPAGAQVVGLARLDGELESVLWSGTPASMAVIGPVNGALSVFVNATDGMTQIGNMEFIEFRPHACLWTGTSESVVDLHPADARRSYGMGVHGNEQVGYFVTTSSGTRAAMWHGTAASMVSLHPPGLLHSHAYATDGVQQVGSGYFQGFGTYPVLWTGTAASFVSLNPGVGHTHGEAVAVSHGVQVGSIGFSQSVQRAALWRGTPASWVELHPAWADESSASAVDGDDAAEGSVQVGSAIVGNHARAMLWHGTAASAVDLHSVLDASYLSSSAWGVVHDATGTYVAGSGDRRLPDGRLVTDAILWVQTPDGPCAPDFNGDGFLDFFDYGAFVACFEGACPPGTTADYNGDGFVDSFDYLEYVEAYETGC